MTANAFEIEAPDDERASRRWMACAMWFELLSLGLLKPERVVAEALCSGEYAEACREAAEALGPFADAASVLGGLLVSYADCDVEEAYHQVLREYTRLFVGERGPLVTPFVGVWAAQTRGQQGLLFVGPESMAVERFMRRCGVAKDLGAGQSNDPVDHIGTMCEFCKFLCLVGARAVVPVEGAVVDPGDFDCFMADYFAPYAAWCAAQIRDLSGVPFYRALAEMLDVAAAFGAKEA
ncbi:TorD/DmsD family molecular chaperone [Xiamenia xianingshaonis]|uniref:Molecular chaperone TorD family protein n=1 Tax=Xiamenia xianingshaonis TaxID=2682776 RepID=A0A9E6STS2_9ACTN|nr:molecular chaperone TorD family protein [Xiamenia xianingshaonis]NHM14705.1 hypothetical protein [Xiamenia xianingshaonis]QTU83755.1 molecular chaperone TorD family protein [Xiamenia xianingshaonis]